MVHILETRQPSNEQPAVEMVPIKCICKLQLKEVNDAVHRIIKENQLIARPSLVETIQHLGRRFKKAEKKSEVLDLIFSFLFSFNSLLIHREKEDQELPSVDLQTLDSELDQKVQQNLKKLQHMKKYRSRYKSCLVVLSNIDDIVSKI